MTDRIWVQVADKDRRVPIEGRRAYFDPDVKHNVRHTPFIQRRLDEKDLVKVDPPAAETVPDASAAATPIAPATAPPASATATKPATPIATPDAATAVTASTASTTAAEKGA